MNVLESNWAHNKKGEKNIQNAIQRRHWITLGSGKSKFHFSERTTKAKIELGGRSSEWDKMTETNFCGRGQAAFLWCRHLCSLPLHQLESPNTIHSQLIMQALISVLRQSPQASRLSIMPLWTCFYHLVLWLLALSCPSRISRAFSPLALSTSNALLLGHLAIRHWLLGDPILGSNSAPNEHVLSHMV